MSDENISAPSSGEQSIPKARLDEIIAQRNRVEQENAFLRGQLSATQRQMAPRAPQAEDPELEAIKADNPVLYKKLKEQEMAAKQLRAGFSTLADNSDRVQFQLDHGDAAKKRMQEVEAILVNERQNGRFGANRSGIYQWLLGQEKLKQEAEAPKAKAPQAKNEAAEDDDAPPSDPKLASTISGGSASSHKSKLTLAESREALKDIEF